MKRAALSAMYLAIGLLASWQSALFASRLAQRYSWPLINTRWHDCWDIEHCQVAWWGYMVIGLFILGPCAGWTIAGFFQAQRLTLSRFVAMTLMLTVITAVFYLGFYIAVWP
ncbi:hypothetical protein P0D69_11310 [Paraburkholderia sediminicola]|uniref:hypothetical protein n=1 Tax=Paraburkholderia sediminicola TaxID=458836 RepID=UPI0038B73FC0